MSASPRRPAASSRAALSAVFGLTLVAVAGSGCGLLKKKGGDAAPPAPVAQATPKGPTAPDIDYAAVRPNELGRIPVIMYHEIIPDGAKRIPLSRTVSEFKKDLELLYAAGFRPVNMADVVNDRIEVPAGMSPVVLTFDDARESQFRLIETPEALKVDPECGMGIMDAFHKAHPDWPMKATFFVLPKSKVTQESFGQLGMGVSKLQYIVDNGMEIGNHTTFHKSLRGMTAAQIQAEIGNAHNVLMEQVPSAKIEVMAVPMGQFPRDKANWKFLRQGTYQGKSYDYKVVMDAAWRPVPSPTSKDWTPARLERIDSVDGLNGIRDWISKLSKAGGVYQRYISDGDPNVISFPKGEETVANLERAKSDGKLLNPYSPFGGSGGAKPIITADAPAGTTGDAPAPAAPAEGTSVAAKPIVSETTGAAPAAASPAPDARPITGAGG